LNFHNYSEWTILGRAVLWPSWSAIGCQEKGNGRETADLAFLTPLHMTQEFTHMNPMLCIIVPFPLALGGVYNYFSMFEWL
jgi:hypothetical protein